MLKLDWNLLFTIINLLILYFALKKFLFAPVCKIIDEREAKIKSELENADKAKEEAEKLKTDYAAELANAQKQVVEITKKASEQAEKVGEAIIENARKESAEIIESAQKQALAEKDKAFDDAKVEIANLALLAAQRVSAKKGSDQSDMDTIDEFLSEVGAYK